MSDYDSDPLVALGEVVRERGMNMRDAWALLDVVGPLIRAEALRDAAKEWSRGEWADVLAHPSPSTVSIDEHATRVRDWLLSQAASIAPEE